MDRRNGWLGRLKGLDRPVAFAIAGIALLLFLFVKIAEEVFEGDTRSLDERIILLFRTPGDPSQPLGPLWFHEMVRDFTALGSTGVLTIITLGVALFLLITGRKRTAVLLLVAIIGGVALSSLLKIGFNRPRPELVPHGMAVFTNSFPSGHSMMSAIVYLTLGEMLARSQERWKVKAFILLMAVFLTLLVGLSRIYLGVHWPSDVLAGWSLGALWALLWWIFMGLLQRGGQVEPDSAPPD